MMKPDRTLALVEKELNEAIRDHTIAEERVRLALDDRTRTKTKMENLQKEFDVIVGEFRSTAPVGASGWGSARKGLPS